MAPYLYHGVKFKLILIVIFISSPQRRVLNSQSVSQIISITPCLPVSVIAVAIIAFHVILANLFDNDF